MKPPPSISVTVLGNGRRGNPKSLVIDTGNTRYLLNCGEGTQRILTEHRSKAARIQHVFLTQMSWDHVSGLLGVALTAKTAGVKKITVHGPPKIEELMQLTRHFADCETTDIANSDILSAPYVDSAFKVQAFTLTATNPNDEGEPDSKRPKSEDVAVDPRATTYAYYFQTYQPRCKLDKSKCIAMGVPRSIFESPAVKDLLEGRSVTLPNGTVVTADQVTGPAPPSPNFLVVDCPSAAFIPSLVGCEAMRDALGAPTCDASLLPGLSFVIHLVPEGLFDLPDYQKFVLTLNQLAKQHCTFDKTLLAEHGALLDHPIHHLVVDGTNCLPPITGIYSQTTVLHRFFDSRIHPLLYDMRHTKNNQNSLVDPLEPHAPVVRAEPQLQYLLRPWQGFSRRDPETLDEERLCEEAFEPLYVTRAEAEKEFAVMREKMAEDGLPSSNQLTDTASDSSYPEITFLGTGSSSPNKYRNISCILVQISPDDFIMMDCGEGSLNQMYALYGPAGTEEILRKLRLILVTHMHADHHGGVFSVALDRARLFSNPNCQGDVFGPAATSLLPVLAPPGFVRWMTHFGELFHYGSIIDLFVLTNLYESPCPVGSKPPICPLRLESTKLTEWVMLLNKLGLEINPIRVPHTGTSWAYLVRGLVQVDSGLGQKPSDPDDSNTDNKRWSILYSGDTPRCDDLIEAGQQCDLLIHEATMIDEHAELATRARHSTLGDAIDVGHAMHAKFTLLNHFSQRYGRLPMLDKFIPDVAVAFDFMKVRLNDLHRLPYYLPYYKYAFAKHWDAQQVKVDAYSWRKVRELAASAKDSPNSEFVEVKERTRSS